jgi:acetate kinase
MKANAAGHKIIISSTSNIMAFVVAADEAQVIADDTDELLRLSTTKK